MYGLPQNIKLAFFNRKTLLQACIGSHDLILNFEGVSVTVLSSIGLADPGGCIRRYQDFAQAAPTLMILLNQKVVCAEGDDAGTLTLKFDGGRKLSIYDDSKEYESYTIKNGGQLIVV